MNTWDMENNYAFIDAQNVNLSIKSQGRKLDWKVFRQYLTKKYKVTKAYLFIGFMPEHQDMYSFFQDVGYHLIFKPVLSLKNGETKGNVDAELVLQAVIDIQKYDKAIIVTGDWDFSCLIKYLYQQQKLLTLIVPDIHHYSKFLGKAAKERLDSLTNLKGRLEYQQKKKIAPTKPKT